MRLINIELRWIFIVFLWLITFCSFSQKDSSKVGRFGIGLSYDQALNFPDKILKLGTAGKASIGLTLSDKRKRFVLYIGGGLKGWKFTPFPSRFKESFINDVQNNYEPIVGYSLDSLIGAKMNNSPGQDFRGAYSQYLHFGVVLNVKVRPIIQFYWGMEQMLLFDDSFTSFTDPEYSDIRYVDLNTMFYELKVGVGIPFPKWDKSFSISINAGYKLVDYRDFRFEDTPLAAYTNNSFAGNFRFSGKFTASIGIVFWTNWIK